MTQRKKQSQATTPSKRPSTPMILVIDDDPITLELVKATLAKAGYQVLTATSGEEGLKAAQKNRPDIIITDVIMPGMDGFMLFKELKRDADTRDKSVLVLSARQNIGDAFRRFGADSFLTKPLDSRRLLSEVQRLLKSTH